MRVNERQLGKTDEAVQALKAAERQFGETGSRDPNSPWGRSVAIYGRAPALGNAGRCAEAKKADPALVSLLRLEHVVFLAEDDVQVPR